jgi:hypothetical protein
MAQSVPSDDTPESVDCPIVKKSYTKIIGNPLDKRPKLWYKVDRKEGNQMTELYRIWWTLNELAKREPTAENIAAAAEALRRFELAEAMLPELTF